VRLTAACLIRQAVTATGPSLDGPVERKDNAMKLNDMRIRTGKILAIAALGLAGFFGVAACTTNVSAPPPTSTATPQPPSPTTQTGPSPQDVAQAVANIAVGNGALTALEGSDGQATSANCDPSTVSNPPDVSTPTTASCDITYSDGSVWQQTVTITFDSQANPVAASTNVGTELSQPAGG
jgi:hypothetical protein